MSGSELRPAASSPADQEREIKRCAASALWFITHYVQIEDVQHARGWIPFEPWPAQADVVRALFAHRFFVVLKARQLGMTWLMLAYALWLMLFRPQASILLFSRRDDEARELLRRLKGMFRRLPDWLQDLARDTPESDRVTTDNEHVWELGSGSTARAFPSTAGDSYTGTFALVDEADLVPDLDALLASVQPTVEAGGQLVLVSRANKKTPASAFKAIYRAAAAGLNAWAAVFLPWHARPGRDQAWYEGQVRDALSRDSSLDFVWEQYPATAEEALAPRQKDKRLPAAWLMRCYEPLDPIPREQLPGGAPLIEGLEVYREPAYKGQYVIGADTAEGNPQSDDSAAAVLDAATGEEVAALCGKFEPTVYALHLEALARWYHDAPVLVERNNHGHAVIATLRLGGKTTLLRGEDHRWGWLTNARGKAQMYADFARTLRDRGTTLHSRATYEQLAGIEGATLSAPEGEADDRAVSFVVAEQARHLAVRQQATEGHAPPGMTGYRG